MPQTTPAMNDDSAAPISFPAVGRKKFTAAFNGGWLTSDGGVLLLAQAERSMGICAQLAARISDRRDPTRVIHTLPDILRARIFAICCGYEDADDLDTLRDDPGFRLALGKLPGSGPGPEVMDYCEARGIDYVLHADQRGAACRSHNRDYGRAKSESWRYPRVTPYLCEQRQRHSLCWRAVPLALAHQRP